MLVELMMNYDDSIIEPIELESIGNTSSESNADSSSNFNEQ